MILFLQVVFQERKGQKSIFSSQPITLPKKTSHIELDSIDTHTLSLQQQEGCDCDFKLPTSFSELKIQQTYSI